MPQDPRPERSAARPRRRRRTPAALCGDQAGQATIEYTMILLVIGLPMILMCRMLLLILVEYYKMVTFLLTLPYP